MSNLSPKAQAVLDAANGASSYGPYDVLNESRWIAVAALRALVKACSFEDFNHQLISVSDVIAIANELDTL
jgi:hypothetical protein